MCSPIKIYLHFAVGSSHLQLCHAYSVPIHWIHLIPYFVFYSRDDSMMIPKKTPAAKMPRCWFICMPLLKYMMIKNKFRWKRNRIRIDTMSQRKKEMCMHWFEYRTQQLQVRAGIEPHHRCTAARHNQNTHLYLSSMASLVVVQCMINDDGTLKAKDCLTKMS